mmetsp:Transcript_17712/g.41074  ORF Transcript_17712/g.41074 Transcript_17712/m.41074 type:complete len:151 (-) Transcript_17712:59-511(-)
MKTNNQACVHVSDKATMTRTVSFGNIQIHEFRRTVGDNPACRGGPPMALSRKRLRHQVKTVDEYEKVRDGNRRTKKEMLMSRTERRTILLKVHSKMDIYEAEDEATKIRESRERAITQLERQERRKLRNVVGRLVGKKRFVIGKEGIDQM